MFRWNTVVKSIHDIKSACAAFLSIDFSRPFKISLHHLIAQQFQVMNQPLVTAYTPFKPKVAEAPSHHWIRAENAVRTNIPFKVMVLGLRGFPNVQGGIETHAEHLCPLLSDLGCHVEVITRTPYQPMDVGDEWNGVKFTRLWAPKSKGFEALVHTFIGVLYAAIKRPDILHIHAIGPALMTPLARLFGLKVVVTHHGPDYNRQKWGFVAKAILLLGEMMGMRFANSRIVISNVIRDIVLRKHTMHSELIFNGVNMPEKEDAEVFNEVRSDILNKLDIKSGRYVLLVSRLVPEKRHFDLIEAFQKANIENCKLVIAGDSDHPDEYVKQLLKKSSSLSNVVMAGYQTGDALEALYKNAGLYVLPSSHEGLSISLLEALSHGLPVIASDIPANLEVGLPDEQYFTLGDTDSLKEKMVKQFTNPIDEETLDQLQSWVAYQYNWENIAKQTLAEYQSIIR